MSVIDEGREGVMRRARIILLALAALAGLPSAAAAESLLVGNKGEDTVSFIDLATGVERARLPTAKAPHEIAVSPDGRLAAVVAYGGTTVDILDVARAKLVRRLELAPDSAPHGIVWLKDGRLVLAAERSRSVVLVDPRHGRIASIATEQAGTHMLATSPDQKLAYASNIGAGMVSVIDLVHAMKTGDIAVGGYPEGLAITRDGRQLWVGDDSAPRVRVVDLASNTTIATLETSPFPIRVAMSPDGMTAIVSSHLGGTLDVFDVASRTLLRTIKVSGSRAAAQVTVIFRDDRRVLVAETGLDQIAEVDITTGAVLRRIVAGKNADGLAIVR